MYTYQRLVFIYLFKTHIHEVPIFNCVIDNTQHVKYYIFKAVL